jgi:hypothetical protein
MRVTKSRPHSTLPPYGPPASLPAGLDWLTYTAEYFPGRRRHDLEAIVAYAAYKRYWRGT